MSIDLRKKPLLPNPEPRHLTAATEPKQPAGMTIVPQWIPPDQRDYELWRQADRLEKLKKQAEMKKAEEDAKKPREEPPVISVACPNVDQLAGLEAKLDEVKDVMEKVVDTVNKMLEQNEAVINDAVAGVRERESARLGMRRFRAGR